MISYQHLDELKQLYILKATGTQYVDPIAINPTAVDENIQLPDETDALHKLISGCFLCDLSKSRREVQVFHGQAKSGLMIISDYPTLAEDNEGAYAGKSGEMLLNMVEKVLELPIEDVYFTHVVKCMPASGKAPNESECKSCQPFWMQQIDNVQPKIIVALGSFSYNLITHGEGNFEKDKGKLMPFRQSQLIAIEHPKVLVRNPKRKAETMQELLLIKSYL
jgi:DNA polymerase